MRPFFMSIVSDGNHWMFVASNGGLTAGRKNAEFALFPYYTDDKITEGFETTGSTTLIRIGKGESRQLWEPFSDRQSGQYDHTRNLYKSRYGNRILFEEVNHDLGLSFRYEWASSGEFGFVRQAELLNTGEQRRDIELIDGLLNILPYGVGSELQNRSSNLVDAYKRSELHAESGLGIFALSAIIVDKAEPSEALKANVAWSTGLGPVDYLLSGVQLSAYRKGGDVDAESDVKGEKGAYLLHTSFALTGREHKQWSIVANVNQDHAAVAELINQLRDPHALIERVRDDAERGTQKLVQLVGAADGLQLTADDLRDTRHFSNVLFNIMRGGTFDDSYHMERADFLQYLRRANQEMYARQQTFTERLPETFTVQDLRNLLNQRDDADLLRLAGEYLPLKFSRRHGDPSRPWNRFSINTHSEVDGSKILDYEGNWRDIFQNWEALAHAYPDFMQGMIYKFLNASTFDGYNPYRVTKDGFDWETIEADDPWSYIGYWGDHQIIYLLKFLEFVEAYQPGWLAGMYDREIFVYANVPYRIKPYADIVKNPKDTVIFAGELDEKIREQRQAIGADGALLRSRSGTIYHVNLLEKLLATVLAKVSNFVPGGGIWMNTQRPEWNDANNALVGSGVSMVTLYYLRRFLHFLQGQLDSLPEEVPISEELVTYFADTLGILRRYSDQMNAEVDDGTRKEIVDALGRSAATYRQTIYEESFSGDKQDLVAQDLKDFAALSLQCCEQTIELNQRPDKLYHAYNLIDLRADGFGVSYLDEMLEGQVAVLSAGYLPAPAALAVMDALRNSSLYREDQSSYILYPNKDLPGFLQKNTLPAAAVDGSQLLGRLIEDGNRSLVVRDVNGEVHFNGNFKNVGDLLIALNVLEDTRYAELAQTERKSLAATFERVFNHKEFTGRSGTFFGYEGLGSIYWHMVSKLQLAVQECILRAEAAGAENTVIDNMRTHYFAIAEGTGVHKSPELYGAFPIDPYSHTPGGKGAQQPGMTGQVKEDILSRIGELGVSAEDGRLRFAPTLLRRSEFLGSAAAFSYVDLSGNRQSIPLPKRAIAFTCCQVPVIYSIGDDRNIRIALISGKDGNQTGSVLDKETSDSLFNRRGEIACITVMFPEEILV